MACIAVAGSAAACCAIGLSLCPAAAYGQQPPAIGYMFPAGAAPGSVTEVVLGGYDWTPDMQVFVHDPQIKLEIIAPPGPVIVPEPPYWFGKKARRPPFLLPRETRARLTIPAGTKPGVVKWQVANANGASLPGSFIVSPGAHTRETEETGGQQKIAALPARIHGRIKHIKEVDVYPFAARSSGPITCRLHARATGSALNGVLEIRNQAGEIIADAADTAGDDIALTFSATAGATYTASIYDLDFRGNRAFVYQLAITQAPRVVAAVPSAGQRGKTQEVEFTGFGIATGKPVLEQVTRKVTFPGDTEMSSFPVALKTAYGECNAFHFTLSDTPQSSGSEKVLAVPCGVTGAIEDPAGVDHYKLAASKGDVLSIKVVSCSIGSRIDPTVAVFDSAGKELVRNDDLPGSTDAAVQFKAPADGVYGIRAGDASSHSGTRAATYHLSVEKAAAGFSLSMPEVLAVPVGGKASLVIKAVRTAGFKEPIDIAITGLPSGVTAPASLQMTGKQRSIKVALTVDPGAAADAGLIRITGTAQHEGRTVSAGCGPLLLACTLPPPFTIDAEGKDDVTKWPRGSTFPAPVLIERNEGFTAPIRLEMSSRQGRHRQGIRGPGLVAPDGVSRVLYPVFLPEWLETTRTSRMVVNGVAKVADAQGNIRYSLSRQKTRMGFLPTGALLKVSAGAKEVKMKRGATLQIPVTVSRARELTGPVTLELVEARGGPSSRSAVQKTSFPPFFSAEPLQLEPGARTAQFKITANPAAPASDGQWVQIRGVHLDQHQLRSESSTRFFVEFTD